MYCKLSIEYISMKNRWTRWVYLIDSITIKYLKFFVDRLFIYYWNRYYGRLFRAINTGICWRIYLSFRFSWYFCVSSIALCFSFQFVLIAWISSNPFCIAIKSAFHAFTIALPAFLISEYLLPFIFVNLSVMNANFTNCVHFEVIPASLRIIVESQLFFFTCSSSVCRNLPLIAHRSTQITRQFRAANHPVWLF